MSNVEQLQRINQTLDRFWQKGTWPGLRNEVTLTSVSGVITLGATYLRLDGLAAAKPYTPPETGCWSRVNIKSDDFMWQPGGPQYFDPSAACSIVAIDQGDNSSGQRVYQLTGDTTTLDAYTYKGFVRKRYVYATDDSTIVKPDCYSALEIGLRAYHADDEQADNADILWAKAFKELDDNLGTFNQGNEYGPIQSDPMASQGTLYNAI